MPKKSNYEQLSLFDIQLPPADECVINQTQLTPPRYAEVPPEEFTYKNKAVNVPTINDILKLLEKGLYKVDAHTFLSDLFECGAIAISNKFDHRQAAEREKRYSQINPAVGFNDYLGELYMRSETSNSKAGQFFTPYNLSKACAAVCVDDNLVNEAIEQDKILTLNEPACGAGGMILAAVDILYNRHRFNYSRNLVVECSDIDLRCVHMSYLQLSLAGVPAVVYHRDTMTMKTWQRWETPAYIMQWIRFRNCLGASSQWYPEQAARQ